MWPFLELFRCVESGLQAAELFLQSDFIPRGPNTLLYNVTGNALLMWLKCSPLWDECVSSRLSSVQMLGSHDEHCANSLCYLKEYISCGPYGAAIESLYCGCTQREPE